VKGPFAKKEEEKTKLDGKGTGSSDTNGKGNGCEENEKKTMR